MSTDGRGELLGRVGRGLEHRLNNLATLLVISSERLSSGSSVTEADAEDLQQTLTRIVDELGLVTDLVSPSRATADARRVVASVASVVSGIHHQVTLKALAGWDEAVVACDRQHLTLLLLASALGVLSGIEGAGEMAFEVVSAGEHIDIKVTGVARSMPSASFAETAAADLETAENLASEINGSFTCVEHGERISVHLSLPAQATRR